MRRLRLFLTDMLPFTFSPYGDDLIHDLTDGDIPCGMRTKVPAPFKRTGVVHKQAPTIDIPTAAPAHIARVEPLLDSAQ
jgi:hypothetical protein